MKRMVDSAQAGEESGRAGKPLAGTFYIDMEPVNAVWSAEKQALWEVFGQSMMACGEVGKALGNRVVVEETGKRLETFEAGPASFYVGWYTLSSALNRGQNAWAAGAIAMEIHSASARDLKHTMREKATQNSYAAFFASYGVAGTLGAFREPFLAAFPQPSEMLKSLASGLTWGEAYWSSVPQLNWQMLMLGDPLYRPFQKAP